MKKNILVFTRIFFLLTGILGASLSRAQIVYTPVPVTGFTDDVVANIPGPANQSANNDMDGGNAPVRYCFLTQNYRNPAGQGPTTFLPATGFFNSAATLGLSFQLADYNANNTLRIKGTGAGTLTFVTPRAARVLYLLGGAGNSQHGNTLFIATINFTDGSTQIFNNHFFTDWFGMLDVVALQGVSRVNFDNNQIENSSTNPSLYQKQLLILPANYGKLIQSITIVKPDVLATLNVLAVSAGSGCTTAPAPGQAVADITTFCGPSPINLSLTGATNAPELTYQWQVSANNGTTWTDIPGATSSTHTAIATQTTQYRARLLCGTMAGASVPVTVSLLKPVSTLIYPDTVFCQLGKSTKPTISPAGGTFSYSPGLVLNAATGEIDLEASASGLHKITYTSNGICPVSSSATIRIEAAPKPVFPNIITPNNDNLNDAFLVKMPPLSEYHMRIFNRWGKLIWENHNANQGWTSNQDGMYYYHVQFKDCAGKSQTYKGWVEVVH